MIRVISIIALLSVLAVGQSCKSVQHLATADNVNLKVEDHQSYGDSPMEAMVRPYRDELQAEMNVVIGYNAADLSKGKVNSSMGNFVSDLLLSEATKLSGIAVDFAIQNYGGLRIVKLPKGDVTKGKLFELMPFDNLLVIVEMKAQDVRNLCNRIADYGGWPISEGVTFNISDAMAGDIMVGGEPLDESRIYQVAMPDYVANGGDACPFMIGLPQTDTGQYIRHVLIAGVEEITAQGNQIEHNPSIRITKK